MLRGIRVDLLTSKSAAHALLGVYERDLRAGEISDEAISAVNTMVRCVEGAFGKTADGVYRKLISTEGRGPYYPITDDPTRFPALLERQLPGLADAHPEVARAIEASQPFNEGREPLRYLKQLYRDNHHHDFTLQVKRQSEFMDILVGGQILLAEGPDRQLSIGGVPWRGVLLDPPQPDAPKADLPNGPMLVAATVKEDGSTEVRINGQKVDQTPGDVEAGRRRWADWHFADPPVSVIGTLLPLHDLCAAVCEEVCSTAGL